MNRVLALSESVGAAAARWIKQSRRQFLLLLPCLLVSCTEVPDTGAKRTSTAAHTTSFTVGAILPLTGELADYGVALRNAIELAQSDYPRYFEKIRIVYEDSRYDPKGALDALNRLRAEGTVNLFHTWGVGPNEAILPVTEANRLPVLAETSLKRAAAGRPHVIRAARTGETAAEILSQELQFRGMKRVAIVLTEIPYHDDILFYFNRLAQEKGFEVTVLNRFSSTDTDFRSSILTAKSGSFDAVGVWLLSSQIINFYRQAQELGFAGQTFGVDIHDSQTLVDACPSNINGVFFIGTDVDADFRKRYTARFGNDIRIGSAANEYDTAVLIGELFSTQRSVELDADSIISAIAATPPRRGVSGEFHFEETAEGGKAFKFNVALREVQGKKILPLTRAKQRPVDASRAQ